MLHPWYWCSNVVDRRRATCAPFLLLHAILSGGFRVLHLDVFIDGSGARPRLVNEFFVEIHVVRSAERIEQVEAKTAHRFLAGLSDFGRVLGKASRFHEFLAGRGKEKSPFRHELLNRKCLKFGDC